MQLSSATKEARYSRWATLAVLLQAPQATLGADIGREDGRVPLKLATSLLQRDVASSAAASTTLADKGASESLLLYADTIEQQRDYGTLIALLSAPSTALLWREATPREREHRLASALAAARQWRHAFAQYAALLDADSDDWSAWIGLLDAVEHLAEPIVPLSTPTVAPASTSTTSTTSTSSNAELPLAKTTLIDVSTATNSTCMRAIVERARSLQQTASPTRAPFLFEFELCRRAKRSDNNAFIGSSFFLFVFLLSLVSFVDSLICLFCRFVKVCERCID